MTKKERLLNVLFVLSILFNFMFVLSSCETEGHEKYKEVKVQLQNPSNYVRSESLKIDIDPGLADELVLNKHGLYQGAGAKIELIKSKENGMLETLVIQTDVEANSIKEIRLNDLEFVSPETQNRTQAEISVKEGGRWVDRAYKEGQGFKNLDYLRVPDEHTDHSYYIRYEGPGWENEMIGYRFYLDWRNAIDIFGKKTDSLVLQNVGQDGYESYHHMADWGMDIMKAGKSLGIGSVGHYDNGKVLHFQETDSVTCEVVNNEALLSSIETNYYGWKTSSGTVSLKSQIEIKSKERAVKHNILLTDSIKGICTGIVKHKKGEKLASLIGSNGWAYLATYGDQSLVEDGLGMGLIYNVKDVEYLVEGEHDHLIVFKKGVMDIQYYILAAWEQETNGIKSKEEFKKYLENKIDGLNNPIVVKLM